MALDRTWYNSLTDDDGSGMTGSVWDKADVDSLMDAVDAEIARLDGRHYAHVARGTAVQLPTATWQILAFDTEVADVGNLWSPGLAGTITIAQTGYYLVEAHAQFAPHATGQRMLSVTRNGAFVNPNGIQDTNGAGWPVMVASVLILSLTAGDVLYLQAYQNSGTTLNVGDSEIRNCRLVIRQLL
jgi:hypothetical protein